MLHITPTKPEVCPNPSHLDIPTLQHDGGNHTTTVIDAVLEDEATTSTSPAIPDGSDASARAACDGRIAHKNCTMSDGSDGSQAPVDEQEAEFIAEYGALVDLSDERPKLNHPAIAAKFVAINNIAYDLRDERFRRYDKTIGLWRLLGKHQPELLVAQFIKKLADELNCPELLTKRSPGLLSGILKLARGMAVMGEANQVLPHIHVANGIVEFIEGEPVLRDRKPADWATTCCNFDFTPGAKATRFLDQLLGPALPDAADIDLLQRWFGAVLLGTNDAQRLLLLHGSGETGKSTFVTIVEHLLGLDRFAELRTGQLSGRFETSFFQGKTLLAAKDVAPDTLLHKGAKNLKSLTGGDLVESEKKFGDKSRLRGCFNIVITSNARLLISLANDESAWIRRLLPVEFIKAERAASIANLDRILLQEEGPGILAWGIQGAAKLLAELKDTGNFVLTPGQQERIKSVVLESRSAEEFVIHGVTNQDHNDVTNDELHDAYVQFCHARKWQAAATKTFQMKLGDLMTGTHGVSQRNDIRRGDGCRRGYSGIAIRNAS